jgi:hypothetical protein
MWTADRVLQNLPAAATAGLGAVLVAWGLALAMWPGVRRYCPGHRTPWWLRPIRLFWAGSCGYDLAGLPKDSAGGSLCPECGHVSRKGLRRRPRVRHWVVGLLLIGAGRAAWRWPIVAHWAWARWAPGMPLAQVERFLGTSTPKPLRDEVADRLAAGTLSPRAADTAMESLIRDLHSDDVRGNGLRAAYRLSALKAVAVPALERALDSPDWQARQLAASALRQIALYEPNDRMLRVTIEGLRDDDLPMQRESVMLGRPEVYSGIANARDGVEYLINHDERIGPFLREGIERGDPQEMLLCAAIAGFAQKSELLPLAAPILVSHLRANHIAGDAKLATPALFAFGVEVAPYLCPVLDSPDRQQRELARLILIDLDLIHPPDPRERSRLARITCRVLDPATDLGASTEDLE